MKATFLSISLAVLVILTACNDQAESKIGTVNMVSSGKIAIDGSASRTEAGILQYSTQPVTQGYYRHELGLVSEGFTTRYDESTGLLLQGEGTGIWLTLNAPSSKLEAGTYTFTKSTSDLSPFDFWYGSVDANGKKYRFTSGVISVQEKHGLYTISIEGTVLATGTTTEKELTATYTGFLKSFKST